MNEVIVKTADAAQSFFNTWTNNSVFKIYNIGGPNFYEYPLFICLNHLVYRIFLDENSLSLQNYPLTDFESTVKNGIFKPSESNFDFYYIYHDCATIESKISKISIKPIMIDGIKKIRQIKFTFENNRVLYVEYSDLVPGAMDSWLE